MKDKELNTLQPSVSVGAYLQKAAYVGVAFVLASPAFASGTFDVSPVTANTAEIVAAMGILGGIKMGPTAVAWGWGKLVSMMGR